MRSRSPLASVRPGSPAWTEWSLLGADDQVPGAGGGAAGDAHRGPGLDHAEADQVIADAAGQLPAQRVVGGHQQRVRAVQGEREVGGRGGVHHLLRLPADDPAVLVVLGQHGGVAGPQPQAGGLFPGGAEPDRLGEPGVAERVGEQGHAAAVLHRLQLLGITGQDHLGAAGRRLADDVGQVGVADHGRLVHQDQVAGPQPDGAAGAALAGQVAQELGAVVGLGDPGGQGVAGRLGRRDADDPPEPGRGPRLARRGQHPRLAGPGGRVDHRDALAVGQHRQRRGGLIHAQPGARARAVRVRARGRPARPRAAPGPRRAPARRPRGSCAARRRRAPARACALPGTAARAWRTALPRAAGRCCARRRAASCAAPRLAPAPAGRPPARTPTAAPGRRDLRAGRRPRPGPCRTGAGPGPGT